MKHKTKKLLKTVGLILVGVILGGAILAAGGTEIKADFIQRDLNKDNLIEVNETYLESGSEKGVEWKVQEDGTIKLYGTATADYSEAIQMVELEAGTYTYDIGGKAIKDVEDEPVYSYVLVGGQQYIAGTDSATFTLESSATVQVVITFFEDAEFGNIFGTTIRPVLVEGDDIGSFYAK